MYTPHTVTVYNGVPDPDSLGTKYNITILDGVFLDVSKGANVMKSGLETADSATLFIPFGINAVNGRTGSAQTYVGPKEYERLEGRANVWTIRPGGATGLVSCFFVKGTVVSEGDFQDINDEYNEVFRVSSVDIRDFGSPDMRHWEVGGR